MGADGLGGYRIERPPLLRQLAMDSFAAVPPGHPITAFMELDVTAPLEAIEDCRRAGARVSLFSHVVRCIAVALSEHPELNVLRHRGAIARFDDVDVNVPVEAETPEGRFPLQVVIRRAQDATAGDIYARIAAAKRGYAREGAMGDEDRWARRSMRWARLLPRAARVALVRRMVADARLVKRRSGTTLVTSVGKFTDIPGFIAPLAPSPRGATFAVGSVVAKPVAASRTADGANGVDGGRGSGSPAAGAPDAVAIRSILALTAVFDHDLVDGAPAARFATRLRALVEGVDGLDAARGGSDLDRRGAPVVT